MKQILHKLSTKDVDNMILIKFGRSVTTANNPAFVSNAVIGKIFGIDGSSVRRLYMKRFEQLKEQGIMTRK